MHLEPFLDVAIEMWPLDTPVSEWGNDEPICASQELILIDGVHITDSNNTLVVILTEVETRLLQPLKVFRRLDLHPHLNPNANK